jgi:hypothetical protein
MTEGYKVTFYRGSQCRGAQLTTRHILSSVCHQVLTVDNQATSAVVQRESEDTPNTGE